MFVDCFDNDWEVNYINEFKTLMRWLWSSLNSLILNNIRFLNMMKTEQNKTSREIGNCNNIIAIFIFFARLSKSACESCRSPAEFARGSRARAVVVALLSLIVSIWLVYFVHVDDAVWLADFCRHVLVGAEGELQRFRGAFDDLWWVVACEIVARRT